MHNISKVMMGFDSFLTHTWKLVAAHFIVNYINFLQIHQLKPNLFFIAWIKQ